MYIYIYVSIQLMLPETLTYPIFPNKPIYNLNTNVFQKPVMSFLREMYEEIHLGNWRPWLKLTITRLVVIKSKPKRHASATHILKTTNNTVKWIDKIGWVTIKWKINRILLLSCMGMETTTISHRLTSAHLTSGLFTTRTTPQLLCALKEQA